MTLGTEFQLIEETTLAFSSHYLIDVHTNPVWVMVAKLKRLLPALLITGLMILESNKKLIFKVYNIFYKKGA